MLLVLCWHLTAPATFCAGRGGLVSHRMSVSSLPGAVRSLRLSPDLPEPCPLHFYLVGAGQWYSDAVYKLMPVTKNGTDLPGEI